MEIVAIASAAALVLAFFSGLIGWSLGDARGLEPATGFGIGFFGGPLGLALLMSCYPLPIETRRRAAGRQTATDDSAAMGRGEEARAAAAAANRERKEDREAFEHWRRAQARDAGPLDS